MRRTLATAGNTLVPAILGLESLGFQVLDESKEGRDLFRAPRGDDEFLADDPVALLGLVKLVEVRSWDWQPTDEQIDAVIHRYKWD